MLPPKRQQVFSYWYLQYSKSTPQNSKDAKNTANTYPRQISIETMAEQLLRKEIINNPRDAY